MYIVQGMKLIPQTNNCECWYVAAKMIVNWRRNRLQMTTENLLDPSEDPESVSRNQTACGIKDAEIIEYAKALGLRLVPPMSPSPSAIERWLRNYGPLWTNGRTHIVVIAGIRNNQVLVYDPLPINRGRIEWRPLTWLAGTNIDSLDPNTDAGIFLYSPF